MSRRISIEIGDESYLDLLERGHRNEYIRVAIDKRVDGVRSALRSLRESRDDHEIELLLGDASEPAANIEDTRLVDLSPRDMVSLRVLWAEMHITGLEVPGLLIALDSGRVV
jgi:hypothetical protein